MKVMDTLERLKYFSDEHRMMVQRQTDLHNKSQALDKEWHDFVGTLGLPEGQVHFADVCKKLLEANIETSSIIKPY